MQKQIEDATIIGQSISKQRILKESKFIDEKLKLMNQMADHMDSYSHKHEIVANTPSSKPAEKVELEDEKPIFYKKKQADEQKKRLKVENIVKYNNFNLSNLKQEEEQRVNELFNNNNTESSIKLDNSFYSY